jgi:hypothetical protein
MGEECEKNVTIHAYSRLEWNPLVWSFGVLHVGLVAVLKDVGSGMGYYRQGWSGPEDVGQCWQGYEGGGVRGGRLCICDGGGMADGEW